MKESQATAKSCTRCTGFSARGPFAWIVQLIVDVKGTSLSTPAIFDFGEVSISGSVSDGRHSLASAMLILQYRGRSKAS